MLHGSCLCRGIRYEINGELADPLNCHCSMCRKAHGAAFRSRARVRAADFRLTSGEELLTFYESSPGTRRGFCRVCGSPIVSKFDAYPLVLGLPLGALDDDPGVRPQLHVYVGSKAPWFTITDDLPQFAEAPPRQHTTAKTKTKQSAVSAGATGNAAAAGPAVGELNPSDDEK